MWWQEIHNKITSIGFEDCKVFIHSVDAQSSANGGIIIQVIGEMSNHGDPWRKFVQTFFLAEQPNGYFVLNDIFRFLKEETVEGDDASEPEAESIPPAPITLVSVPEQVSEPALPPPAPAVAPEPVLAPPPVEEPPTTVIPESIVPTPAPESTPQKVNGIHTTAPEPIPELPPVPALPAEPRAPTPEPVAASPVPSVAPDIPPSAPAPVSAPTQPAPAAVVAPPPQPAAPPAPKTWANLAATNSKKWGAAVAQESRGTTEVPVSPAPVVVNQHAPISHHAHPSNNNTTGRGPGVGREGTGVHPAVLAVQSVTTAQCFVKGVTEPITPAQLTAVLTHRFGPIKDQAEIVRSKACAFLEFQTLDAARRAIIACLPVGQGGEGGVRIDVGGDVGNIRIIVETRKERGDRPVSRPRGGAPINGGGDARGGFRGSRGAGGGGSGGRGRAGPK